ncbi:MAG: acetylornithine transaminase [Candidatus Methanoplasma sp.]|jgi:acetylornithine aminotransferase/acetylornithine/N-succinyldiaminopimelate aminotransferase|nr:acetylornithine transaminase [Candidatus Methanoplasma sp.]
MKMDQDIVEATSKYLFPNYGRIGLAFERGEGSYLYGTDGKRYLDLVAGIAVNSLGYAHPKWVARVQEQAAKMAHVSNLYFVKEQAELAEKIAAVTPGDLDRTLFVNSGAEANEGAMKLAVRYTGRGRILSALNGFHGRTSASLGATGQTKYQQSFESLISGAFRHYDYGDVESVKELLDKDVAALLYEPIQGEGGVVSADPGFYKALREVCSDNGTLLIADEVQTGVGRTGKWYGTEHYGVMPDIITMAKGLGGGTPIGAVVSTAEISDVMTPGTHGTTFGGNPLVCAAGCAVIDAIREEKLLENVASLGKKWISDLKGIRSESIKDVRGQGFMIGVETDSDETARRIQAAMRENGILINVCHGRVIRLIPPLILTGAQKDSFTSLLKEIIA